MCYKQKDENFWNLNTFLFGIYVNHWNFEDEIKERQKISPPPFSVDLCILWFCYFVNVSFCFSKEWVTDSIDFLFWKFCNTLWLWLLTVCSRDILISLMFFLKALINLFEYFFRNIQSLLNTINSKITLAISTIFLWAISTLHKAAILSAISLQFIILFHWHLNKSNKCLILKQC